MALLLGVLLLFTGLTATFADHGSGHNTLFCATCSGASSWDDCHRHKCHDHNEDCYIRVTDDLHGRRVTAKCLDKSEDRCKRFVNHHHEGNVEHENHNGFLLGTSKTLCETCCQTDMCNIHHCNNIDLSQSSHHEASHKTTVIPTTIVSTEAITTTAESATVVTKVAASVSTIKPLTITTSTTTTKAPTTRAERTILVTKAAVVTTVPPTTTVTSTTKAEETDTVATPTVPTPVVCEVCTGRTCGLIPGLDPKVQCTADTPYCMNTVDNDGNGMQTITKRCASVDDCVAKWWLESSDRSVCNSYNHLIPYSYPFTCNYCCVTNTCNSDIKPNSTTMFKGSD